MYQATYRCIFSNLNAKLGFVKSKLMNTTTKRQPSQKTWSVSIGTDAIWTEEHPFLFRMGDGGYIVLSELEV